MMDGLSKKKGQIVRMLLVGTGIGREMGSGGNITNVDHNPRVSYASSDPRRKLRWANEQP